MLTLFQTQLQPFEKAYLYDRFHRSLITLFQNYNPKRGYGYVHFSRLSKNAQVQNLAELFPELIQITNHYVPNKQCFRYSIPADVYQEYVDQCYLGGIVHTAEITNNYVLAHSSIAGIRINETALSMDPDGRSYLVAWRANGSLVDGKFKQKLFRKENSEERFYECGALSYQTMPNRLKALAAYDDQYNMDIVGCHTLIAGRASSGVRKSVKSIQSLFTDKQAKIAILAVLNGGGWKAVKKELGEINQPVRELFKSLMADVKDLAAALETVSGKLWKHFHKIEQSWIKTITDYLDAIEVGYANMHDGLMIDQYVDLSGLNLPFKYINKPLS